MKSFNEIGLARQTPSARKFLDRMTFFAGAIAVAMASVGRFSGIDFGKPDVDYKRRAKLRSASYTKKGPGRRPRWGATRPPLDLSREMDDGMRCARGYMNRGERERYLMRGRA